MEQTLLKYPQFMLHHMARPGKELTIAPIEDIVNIVLPKETVLHFLPDTPGQKGIGQSDSLLANWPRNIRVHFVEEADFPYGRPIKQQVNLNKLKQDYFKTQKGVRRSRNLEKDLMDDRDMVVFDYTPLLLMVRYNAAPTVYQDAWKNVATSIIDNINKYGTRPHFYRLNMPSVWGSETDFRASLETISADRRDLFRDSNSQWLLEIYRYVAQTPSLLDVIKYDHVVFVISVGLKCVFLPMVTLTEIRDTDTQAKSKIFDLYERLLSFRTVVDTDAIESKTDAEMEEDDIKKIVPPAMERQINELISAGRLTKNEQARIARLVSNTQEMANPLSPDIKLVESGKITPDDLKVSTDINPPVDYEVYPKHAAQSSVKHFKTDYQKDLYKKDLVNVILSLQNAGVMIKGFNVKTEADAIEEMNVLKLNLLPIMGTESTFELEIPTFQPDGSFIMGGVRYTMDSQRSDLPIRKTNFNAAAITSYAGKIFIGRSELVKNDYGAWLKIAIGKVGKDSADKRITTVRYTNQSIPLKTLPRDYTSLMTVFSSFQAGDLIFDFIYDKRIEKYGADEVMRLEKRGKVICGTYAGKPMTMDMTGVIESDDFVAKNILEAIGGDWGKIPKDIAMFKSKGKDVPVIIYLGFLFGLDKVIRKTKAKVRWEGLDKRAMPAPNEIFINFKNERMYVNTEKGFDALIWNGLKDMESMTKGLDSTDFNRKAGWYSSLSLYNLNTWHTIEWQLMDDMFLDPMTIDVLKLMDEPTNLEDLFLRAVELITTDDAPKESSTIYQRFRGLERFNGLLYTLLYEAVREQRRAPNPAREKISLPVDAFKARLNRDTAVQLAAEINPVHALKEQEAVTQAGEGGRTARTLVKRNRVYDENDLGVISEHSPDSSKVGIRQFLTPNAKIKNMRGMVDQWKPEDGSTSLLSTTALLLPDMDRDAGKRANLGAVQQSAVSPAYGYTPSPYRTGEEEVIASRLNDFFVFTAKYSGEVSKVNDSLIQVLYDNGEKEGYRLGVKHGKDSGEIIPHQYTTDLKVGHRFKENDVLAWNKGFFTRSLFNKANVTMMSGTIGTVALMEGNDTYEDSSAIGDFREKLKSYVSKNKGILLDGTQDVTDLVKVGDVVEYNSALCQITEGALSGLDVTDATTLTLSKLGAQNPKAETSGRVTRVEVFYMGNIEEFSESVKALINTDNKRRAKEVKELNSGSKIGLTGELRRPSYVAGEKITDGKVVVSIYIDHDIDFGTGDKLVAGNQLKTINGRVMTSINRTESGVDIDLKFGARSERDRIVNSFVSQGFIIRTVETKNKQLADEYLNGGE